MNQFYQKEYMSRQTKKVKIQYQNDTTSNFLVGFSDKSRQTDNKTLSAMETAILGKRNRLHYKAKDLQKLIQRNKVNRLVTTLIKKTRLNSIYRTPYQFEKTAPPERISNQDFKQKFRNVVNKAKQHKGIQFGNIGLIIWSITNIIQITIMVFIFCIMMAFPQTQDFSTFIYFRSMSIALYVIDMFLNFSVKRYENGKYLEEIGQISSHYLKHGFTIDLVSILIFPIDLLVTTKTNITILISFVALFKLVNNVSKFQKFEYLLINSTGKEHYYGLIRVFLTNFAIGHFLSILLNLMAGIDDSNNWQLKIGISQQEWYIKYIWGYYWGTNIMLTVGFGDICAQNYYEAILLVFIETFSCITLAYNINYVGALIGSIRSRNEQKKKKLKIFHRMCKENFVSNEMESKVTCHIQEQYRIKQQFQFEAHDQVLKTLPRNLQTQFRKEANKTLFDNIGFLNNLSKKSLLKLAQIISRKICHPEEIVLGKGCISDFTILQKGYVTFNCRVRSNIDGAQIECIDIKQGQKPKILSLNFIKNKIVNYIIKSKSYSILYYLIREDVMESLRNSEMDFQMFCQLKDKDQNGLDENNLYLCTVCKNEYHNKFECSRLHFIPLKRKVILKYIHEVNKVKQHRQVGFHRNKRNFKPCRSIETLRNEQRRYIEQNFDDEHYLQIQNLLNFYNNLNFDPTHQFESKCKRADFLTHTSNKSNSNMISLMNDKALVKLQQILENKNNKLIYNVWEFQIDQAQNFNFYFRQGNPDQLKKQKRSKRRGIFSY